MGRIFRCSQLTVFCFGALRIRVWNKLLPQVRKEWNRKLTDWGCVCNNLVLLLVCFGGKREAELLSVCLPVLNNSHNLWVVTKWMRSQVEAVEKRFLRSVSCLSRSHRVSSSFTSTLLFYYSTLSRVELLLYIKRSQSRRYWHLTTMSPRHLLGEHVLLRRGPRTGWRNYISWLAWERSGIPPEWVEGGDHEEGICKGCIFLDYTWLYYTIADKVTDRYLD